MGSGSDTPVALITGACSGIGLEVALGLAEKGWNLLLVSESAHRLSVARVRTIGLGASEVTAVRCDLSDLDAVAAATSQLLRMCKRLDAVVLNAATLSIGGTHVDDGLRVNYLSAFMMTNMLLPLLQSPADAKVVALCSDLHRYGSLDRLLGTGGLPLSASGPDRFKHRLLRLLIGREVIDGYARSKLALLTFVQRMARLEGNGGVSWIAIHPGVVKTGITGALSGPRRAIWAVLSALVGMDSAQGAAPVLRLLFAVSSGHVYHVREAPERADERSLDIEAQELLQQWS
jgi:NAD(P)-dependent dehydrogenase (short-subunit alcohol dehydrogenase family)